MTELDNTEGRTILYVDWTAPRTWRRYVAICIAPVAAIVTSIVFVRFVAERVVGLSPGRFWLDLIVAIAAMALAYGMFAVFPRLRRIEPLSNDPDIDAWRKLSRGASETSLVWFLTTAILTSALSLCLLQYLNLESASRSVLSHIMPIVMLVIVQQEFSSIVREFLATEIPAGSEAQIAIEKSQPVARLVTWGFLVVAVLAMVPVALNLRPFVAG